jgi:DNA-directed RNA polymerase alpha subunit
MSTRLCFALARIETTIREILEKHTVNDLLQYRGIGSTSIDEFKNILKDHGCLSLLRDK